MIDFKKLLDFTHDASVDCEKINCFQIPYSCVDCKEHLLITRHEFELTKREQEWFRDRIFGESIDEIKQAITLIVG